MKIPSIPRLSDLFGNITMSWGHEDVSRRLGPLEHDFEGEIPDIISFELPNELNPNESEPLRRPDGTATNNTVEQDELGGSEKC